MRHVFHPEAVEEYEDATRYYAARSAGLADRFIECIEAALSHIVDAPERWRVLEGDIRRYVVRIFPYVILYSIEPEYVLILAVMHCKREPGYWRARAER
jgi:toxin ParE1/3/4